MLPNYSGMFTTLFIICSFAAVNSQAPVAFNPSYSSSSQSVSYSGPGSSSAASSGSATSYVSNSGLTASFPGSLPKMSPVSNAQVQSTFPPVAAPNEELFAHSLTQVLQSSSVLNADANKVITNPYASLYEVGRFILERDNVLDPSLAVLLADAGKYVGVITKKLYFNSISHMFAKLLSLNNRLTQETAITYPSLILSYIEDYGIKNGILNSESVVSAVSNGLLNFASSIGINTIPNLTSAFKLLAQELITLDSGVNI